MKAVSFKTAIASAFLLGVLSLPLPARAQDLNFDQAQAGAAKGDPVAEFCLGRFYFKGQGVPQDDSRALELFRKAADQGNGMAQNNLGVMYLHGLGVKPDQAEAIKWLDKAAAQSLPRAEVNLASILIGQPEKEAQGLELYRKAAEQGDVDAQVRLMDIYYFGFKDIKKDYSESAKWASLAANQGNAKAENTFGAMNEMAMGVPKNLNAASDWYRKSAEQGNAKGEANYGRMFTSGQGGVELNPAKAYMWWKLGSMQGEATASVPLGEYIKGMKPEKLAEGKRLLAEHIANQLKKAAASQAATSPAH